MDEDVAASRAGGESLRCKIGSYNVNGCLETLNKR